MSIQSEIDRISQNIAAAYTALEAKGATMPDSENSDNLADTINTITAGSGGVTEWNGELYADGNEYESVTGGWYGLAWKMSSAVTASETVNIDREDTYIKMYLNTAKTRRSGFLLPVNKIDLTDFNTLTFLGGIHPEGAGNIAYGYIYILESLTGAYANASYVSRVGISNNSASTTVNVDISGLSGEYYIAVCLYSFDTPSAYLIMESMKLS